MASVTTKLAALRARRASHTKETSPAVDGSLSAIAAAVGEPQVSWDYDYKDRIRAATSASTALLPPSASPCATAYEEDVNHDEDRGADENAKALQNSLCLSEEEEGDEELVVLPPPARKLSSVAQRRLWRLKEMGRAREKAAQILLETRPPSYEVDGRVPQQEATKAKIERLSSVSGHQEESKDFGSPADPDQDEEEYALRYAEDKDEEDGGDDPEVYKEDPVLQRSGDKYDVAQDAEGKLSRDGKASAAQQTKLCEMNEHLTAIDSEATPKGTNGECSGHVQETSEPQQDTSPNSITSEEQSGKVLSTIEYNNSSQHQTCDSHEGRGVANPVRKKRRLRRGGIFAGLIENEADVDQDGVKKGADPYGDELDENSSEDEEIGYTVDSIETGAERFTPSDEKKLAVFHRQWDMEKEKEDIMVLQMGPHRRLADDLRDDAVDFTNLGPSPGPDPSQLVGAEHDAAVGNESENDEASVGGGGEQIQGADYVEAMFLRDDSHSRAFEEVADGNNEGDGRDDEADKREKARALWKARQKLKSTLADEDENSLSRFDIFEETDRSRSLLFRKKLENSCRPIEREDFAAQLRASTDRETNVKKRQFSWLKSSSVPEWEKRKACHQQKEMKRRQAISVGKWSFSSYGQMAAQKSSKRSSTVNVTRSAATYVARKMRSRDSQPLPPSRRTIESTKPSAKVSSVPTSVSGLLSILGERAETGL